MLVFSRGDARIQQLSCKNLRVLEEFCKFYQQHGICPSSRELGKIVGKTQTAIRRHLLALIDHGFVKQDYSRHRAMVPVSVAWVDDPMFYKDRMKKVRL